MYYWKLCRLSSRCKTLRILPSSTTLDMRHAVKLAWLGQDVKHCTEVVATRASNRRQAILVPGRQELTFPGCVGDPSWPVGRTADQPDPRVPVTTSQVQPVSKLSWGQARVQLVHHAIAEMTCGDFPEHRSCAPQSAIFDLEKRGRRCTNRGIDAEGIESLEHRARRQ